MEHRAPAEMSRSQGPPRLAPRRATTKGRTHESPDAELVAAVRAGDPTALAGIYDRHADALHSFAVRTLGSPHDAADAVQDAFVLAFQRMDQLRDPTRLRPWLYAIVRNECTRVGRARARVVPVSPGAGHDPEARGMAAVAAEAMGSGAPASGARGAAGLGPDAVDGDPVGTAAERAADVAVLHDALGGLDERDRALFALQADRGLEGRDLADAAGLPPRQLGQATARMRDRLERSIISLLVSRHGRRDCTELGQILTSWDGRLTVLLRKRVSRHIDACDTCQARQAALVLPVRSALAAPLLVIAAPADLRRRVLEQIAALGEVGSVRAETDLARSPETRPDGVPPRPRPVSAGSRRPAVIGAAVALVVVIALVSLWAVGGGATEDAAASAGPAPSSTTLATPSSATPPSTTEAASPAEGPVPQEEGVSADEAPDADTAPPTGAAPADAAPSAAEPAPDLDAPPGPELPEVEPPPTPAVPDPAPPGESPPERRTSAPAITAVRGPVALDTATCPATARGRVTASVTGTGLTVELLTEGIGAPATTPMATDGSAWTATVGPYTQPGTVTARVRATDPEGRTATSEAFTFRVQRCAG